MEWGAISDAPDWGINGERKPVWQVIKVLMDDLEEEVQIVTASLRGTTLFELFDPRNLLMKNVGVLDARMEAEPMVLWSMFTSNGS